MINKIPSKLSDITLSQWIEFQNTYGQDLDNRFKLLTGDAMEKLSYDVDHALCHYCFYTGVPVNDITPDLLPEVLKQQNISFVLLKKDEAEINYHDTFIWDNEPWKIAPVLKFKGRLTRAEFEISQDIALIFSDLQDGRHEALYNLCAAFFRKENESYSSWLVDDKNERVIKMHDLPLNMALATRAYVIDSINIYLESLKVK